MGKISAFILKALGVHVSLSVLKSIRIRFRGDNHHREVSFLKNNFFQKCMFLFRILTSPLFVKEDQIKEPSQFIFEPYSLVTERIQFAEQFSKSQNQVKFITGKKTLLPKKSKYLFPSIWKIFLKAAILNFFIKNKGETKYLWPIYNFILSFDGSKNHQYFFFRPYSLSIYISLLILSKLNPSTEYYLVTSNTSFFPRRYTHLPEVNLIYCSNFQRDELNFFQNLGWSSFRKVLYGGLEEVNAYLAIHSQKAKYHIGIYSSGFWARSDGLSRVNNIKKIQNYFYSDNENQKDFESLIITLGSISKKYNLKSKLYFHPYEKELFHKFKIIPPYLNTLKKFQIDYFFDDKENSIHSVYESSIGCGLFSTILTDRWNIGLNSLLYIKNPKSEHINPKYLGNKSNHVFFKLDDFESEIIKLLNLREE